LHEKKTLISKTLQDFFSASISANFSLKKGNNSKFTFYVKFVIGMKIWKSDGQRGIINFNTAD